MPYNLFPERDQWFTKLLHLTNNSFEKRDLGEVKQKCPTPRLQDGHEDHAEEPHEYAPRLHEVTIAAQIWDVVRSRRWV